MDLSSLIADLQKTANQDTRDADSSSVDIFIQSTESLLPPKTATLAEYCAALQKASTLKSNAKEEVLKVLTLRYRDISDLESADDTFVRLGERIVDGNWDNSDILTSHQKNSLAMITLDPTNHIFTDEEKEIIASAANIVKAIAKRVEELESITQKICLEVAPNLCVLLGPPIALACIIATEGNLKALASMPAQNFQNLARNLNQIPYLPWKGLFKDVPLVASASEEYKARMTRRVAGKARLAASYDVASLESSSSYGEKLVKQLRDQMEAELAEVPVRDIKPLKRPDPVVRPKRGGRRARMIKKRYSSTVEESKSRRIPFCNSNSNDI